MILSEDKNNAAYQIQFVLDDGIIINKEKHTKSLIISPDQLIPCWNPASVDTLTSEDLLLLITLNPEIILLGTGKKSVILSAKKLAPLLEKQFHMECMSTQAACRTYTILSAQGCRVAAGLIIERW